MRSPKGLLTTWASCFAMGGVGTPLAVVTAAAGAARSGPEPQPATTDATIRSAEPERTMAKALVRIFKTIASRPGRDGPLGVLWMGGPQPAGTAVRR